MPEVEQPKSIFQLIPRVVALVVTSMLMESEYMDDKPASTTGVVWKDFLKSIRPLDLDLLEKTPPVTSSESNRKAIQVIPNSTEVVGFVANELIFTANL